MYDGSAASQPRLTATVHRNITCGGQQCWKPVSIKGFQYKDKLRKADGVFKIKLKAGAAGKGKLIVKAKGTNMPPLPLPMVGAVTAQVVNSDGQCWGADYVIKKNTNVIFKGKHQGS